MMQPSVLIVGAGAMGMVMGYHLQLGGAQVTFLVRPGRGPDFSPPRRLYCYDDHQLKTFDGYRVVEDVAAIAHENFDWCIVTLDGATARTPQSTAMLAALGRAFVARSTVMIIGGVGVGLREHFVATTGLPQERLLNGTLGLLAHSPTAGLPLHAPTDAALLAQSAIAYHHFPNRVSFMLDTRHKQPARAFAQVYGRSGLTRCALLNPALFAIITNSAFPMLLASEIAGWPSVGELVKQRELWNLSCRATGEVASLKQHGWIGKVIAAVMTPGLSAKVQLKVEKDSLPLDYQAFNAYHHGNKVQSQDVQVMRNCVTEGRRQGRRMSALAELLKRLDESHKARGISVV